MFDTAQITSIAMPVLDKYGCDLVTLTFMREKPGLVLRLLVEKKGFNSQIGSGVDLKDCAGISKELDALLEDEIDVNYILEVSSAGIERPLVKEADFERFKERLIAVKTRKALNGRKKFNGVLLGIDLGNIKLEITQNKDKKVMVIPFDEITKANLVFDAKMLKRRAGE